MASIPRFDRCGKTSEKGRTRSDVLRLFWHRGEITYDVEMHRETKCLALAADLSHGCFMHGSAVTEVRLGIV